MSTHTHTHTSPEVGANSTHHSWPVIPQTDPVPWLQRPPAGPCATTFASTKWSLSSLIPLRSMGRRVQRDQIWISGGQRHGKKNVKLQGWVRKKRKRVVRKRGRELKRRRQEERNKRIRILSALMPRAVYLADWVKHKPLTTLHIPDNITVALL